MSVAGKLVVRARASRDRPLRLPGTRCGYRHSWRMREWDRAAFIGGLREILAWPDAQFDETTELADNPNWDSMSLTAALVFLQDEDVDIALSELETVATVGDLADLSERRRRS